MKIIDIDTSVLFEPFPKTIYSGRGKVSGRDILITQLTTDVGIKGYSFITGLQVANGAEIKVLDLIIREGLKGIVLAKDPLCYEKLWYEMYRGTVRFGRRGAALRAISAVDIAIWDIIGKKAGLPIWQLAGGFKESIPAYASGGHYIKGATLDDISLEVQDYIKKGFKQIKIRVGRASLKEDTERIDVIRNVMDDEIKLMVDAGEAWDGPTAIAAAKMWEKYNISWIEEPVPTDDLDSLCLLKSKTSIPIAVGENEYTRYGFRDLIQAGAVSIIQPDVTRVGGISEWLKIAHLASAHGIKVAPHGIQEIHTSLAAGIENGLNVEYASPDYYMQSLIDKVFKEPVNTKQISPAGNLVVPQSPGLGLEIDWDIVEKYKI